MMTSKSLPSKTLPSKTLPTSETLSTGPTAPAATDSYAASYARLAAIAERLRAGGTAISVDTLVEDVRAARAAHDVCRARLEAVRAALDAEVAAAETGEAADRA